MNRRNLLLGILTTATAPAIVRADSLMQGRGLIVPQWASDEGLNDWRPFENWRWVSTTLEQQGWMEMESPRWSVWAGKDDLLRLMVYPLPNKTFDLPRKFRLN